MSFYGGNQNGAQPGSAQQQQIGRQSANPGLTNVQQVLTPQLFNINVNPNQLHNFFNEHNSSQNTLQLNAAAANASSILLQQQPQSFPVNLLNEQLGVGVGQLLSSATVSQNQMQGLPISMPSALNFPQALQVHAQTPPPQQSQSQGQQSKQKVFTGTVTKTHDNFGFIDEEVFFQMGVVKGPILPKEGDRVLVEADFNASMPFKWNATRVQIVNMGGSLNSSLNNMSSISASQSQHMGFNPAVGIQKQTPPSSQPSLVSQPNPSRMHGPQPVTIVSNPHSVYSGGTNPRVRPAGVGPVVPAPVVPMVPPQQQRDPKRTMGLPMPPDPPVFTTNSSGGIPSDREHRDMDRDRCRDPERSRVRERSPERSRERMRERSRERVRPRSRDRSRERIRDRSRERDRDKLGRARSRSRDRDRLPRDRSRERSPDRKIRGGSREREDRAARERSLERSHSNRRRSRSVERRERERITRPREKPKSEQVAPERVRERESSKDRKGREVGGKASTKDSGHGSQKASPAPTNKNNKEEPRVDSNKGKEKDKRPIERAKPSNSASTSSDRSKRSRSRESIRTDKGHSTTNRSRSRSASPKRSTTSSTPRPPPRYAVELPKFPLNTKDIGVKELQRRYPNLYIPSDFFMAKSSWMETFPLQSPFDLGRPCTVQIMRKGVHKIELSDTEALEIKFKDTPDILEPADASNIFKAKVMIPSMSHIKSIYKKSCGVNENGTESADNTQHLDRLISFVVGMKTSKHEVMALGGPWSPSLDGSNPQSDSQTLINTAIRCVRALTGINLSRCKHWYRFMELYYKRSNCLETVVYYLPDVWSCLPGTKEWSTLKSMYKFALLGEKPAPIGIGKKKEMPSSSEAPKADTEMAEAPPQVDSKQGDSSCLQEKNETVPTKDASAQPVDKGCDSSTLETSVEETEINIKTADEDNEAYCSGVLVIDEAASPSKDDGVGEEQHKSRDVSAKEKDENPENGVIPMEESEQQNDTNELLMNQENLVVVEGELSKDLNEPSKEMDTEGPLEEPARLNPKGMNVAQLREELGRRNLSSKGLKPVLISRLAKALKDEIRDENEVKQAGVQNETVQNSENNTTVENNAEGSEVKVAEESEEIVQQNISSEIDTKKECSEIKTEEPCIRVVNLSSIFEDQDDDVSIEDGEVKDDLDAGEISSINCSEFDFISKFPPETFPIIKPGMKEEEIKMLERRYTLPKNPRLLVFPSESAKCRNFDCISMTLGLLRDYRIIDKKEDNFEVSLFSEFFHEMLQRDFAFRIYKEIVTESGKEEDANKEIKGEADTGEPATKRRKLSNNSSTSSAQQVKKITDPYLLLSFVFFDVTRCGYVTESDLEDLCSCIGIGLTRSQIRKVVQRIVHKGNLYYRKWTDRSEKLKSSLSSDDVKILAQGNGVYFPVFVLQEEKDKFLSENEGNSEAVIAQVDGKSVDVKKLLEKLHECERNLAVAESSLNVMKNSMNESKSQVTELKKSNDSLKDELSKSKDALKKAEGAEKCSKESLDTFKRASERFCERVKDLIKFPNSNTSSAGVAKEKVEVTQVAKEDNNTVTE